MKSLLWVRQSAQRRKTDAAELKRRIAKFGRLLPQLEEIAFDEHVPNPIASLRCAYDAAAKAVDEDRIRLCRSADCLNRDRGRRSVREEYCSDTCYDRDRAREHRERRRKKS